jgi:hypothetical protein
MGVFDIRGIRLVEDILPMVTVVVNGFGAKFHE